MSRFPTFQRAALTRRSVLSAGAVLFAPPAWAFQQGAWGAGPQSGVHFPLRVGYARIGPEGFLRLDAREQTRWSTLQVRLGALVARITPLQPADMFGAKAPLVDGGAACALAARQMAADAGLGHVLLYAVDEGTQAEGGWIAQCFAALRAAGGAGHVSGEAHLLDVTGGPPVDSVFSDAPRRGFLGALGGRPRGATQALDDLALGVERRIQEAAAQALESRHSMADGFMRTPR